MPGFRKQAISVAAVQAGLVSASDSSGSPTFFSVPKANVTVSFRPGEMDYTGDEKNAGIDGSGFFQLQLANGTPAVTRDGEFQIKVCPRGQLVTKEGYTVNVSSNGPIQMDVHNHSPITIAPTGEIRQGADVKGKLELTDFENPELLTQTNGVYFLATNPGLITKPGTGTLREGFQRSRGPTAVHWAKWPT